MLQHSVSTNPTAGQKSRPAIEVSEHLTVYIFPLVVVVVVGGEGGDGALSRGEGGWGLDAVSVPIYSKFI